MARGDHPSQSNLDPAIVLAIRDGVAAGMQPVLEQLDQIDAHLTADAVARAKLEQRIDDYLGQPKSDRTAKPDQKKLSFGDRVWQTIAFAVATSIGTSVGMTVLTAFHKGTP
jgi:hypothetical protein